jgi:hypothetical protein
MNTFWSAKYTHVLILLKTKVCGDKETMDQVQQRDQTVMKTTLQDQT